MVPDTLPPVLQEILHVIGTGPTLALVREFGGQELTLPRTEGSAAWAALAEVIGEEALRRLSDAFRHSGPVYIALRTQAIKHERHRRLIARYEALLREGHSGRSAVALLVREFQPISYRWVERLVNRPAPGAADLPVQGELPF